MSEWDVETHAPRAGGSDLEIDLRAHLGHGAMQEPYMEDQLGHRRRDEQLFQVDRERLESSPRHHDLIIAAL